MSRGETPSAFNAPTTSDNDVPPDTSASRVPGSSIIPASVLGRTTVSPSAKGLGWTAIGVAGLIVLYGLYLLIPYFH